MARVFVLQAGRGIAALAVVAYHAAASTQTFAGALPAWIETPASYGGHGVDFFFVLSGFIIHRVSREFDPRHYVVSRFRRVFLPYWPVGIGIAAAYVLMPGISAEGHSWNWLGTITLLGGQPALIVAWTLQFEIAFYIAYGFARWFGHPVIGVALFAAVSALCGITLTTEFLFGVLACEAVNRRLPVWPLALPALAACVFFPHREMFGLVCAFAIVGLVQAEDAGSIRVPVALAFLGDASYAIYLVHNPICAVAARFIAQPVLCFASIFIVGSAAGIAYHLAIERPLLSFGHHDRKAMTV